MNTELSLRVKHWLSRDPDEASRAALEQLLATGDEAALMSAFSGRLDFGTAGIRGIVGPGPMGMNRLLVRETSAGLGAYLESQVKNAKTRGVVIGFDGRHDSRTFANDAASVLTAMGFKVMLSYTLCPTPLVAFGVKHLGAAAGIVVTASHNPPKYNGYKVYWENGAQIIPPHDSGIAACIEVAANAPLPWLDEASAMASGLLTLLEDDFYQQYRRAVAASTWLQGEPADTNGRRLSLAYTAMHGVGAPMAEQVLADAGFNQVYSVAAQREADGDFPTVNFPNPEEKGAMDRVIAEASAHGADLACANDPDADRFALAARRPDGSYRMLSGDQVGALLGDYLLSRWQNQPGSQGTPLVGNTIVSSALLHAIAAHHKAESYTTLTGFKWLMNIAQQRQTAEVPFLFAYEEALGYTVGNLVWDKDGLTAQLCFAHLAEALARQGKTVWDALERLYRRHGLYVNRQVSIALGPNTPDIGAALRKAPPSEIAGRPVLSVEDLKALRHRFADGREQVIDLPASDVLIFHLGESLSSLGSHARVIVRPSGTEPKIKCYYELVLPMAAGDAMADAEAEGEALMAALVSAHQAGLPA
ncbi:phospho-sugar mutase [Shewanella sp. JM162201]|uniref:Phospho-sugar mutase n=1 Tax=Shewanella jiangmenensis TaxID=2837387 RepID=A0ABS5V4R6_9GAMM|nr:phospho-sugar mutase [Shewanella jiangmenensis]MBT1444812.1 phospho-sugar mutase [Shewanella jiangmenensis]